MPGGVVVAEAWSKKTSAPLCNPGGHVLTAPHGARMTLHIGARTSVTIGPRAKKAKRSKNSSLEGQSSHLIATPPRKAAALLKESADSLGTTEAAADEAPHKVAIALSGSTPEKAAMIKPSASAGDFSQASTMLGCMPTSRSISSTISSRSRSCRRLFVASSSSPPEDRQLVGETRPCGHCA